MSSSCVTHSPCIPSVKQPIAIVGIGCRFPNDLTRPDTYFDFLLKKRSAIVEVPPDRWDAEAFHHPDFQKPGHIHIRRGGFLFDIDRFDPGFFGISPKEAARMDPQQRLLLETCYDTIEDAGYGISAIAGGNTAVFMGCSGHDYDAIQSAPSERFLIGPTSNTGNATSIVANRVSYIFDFKGPSVAVDTACSSSLTAVHLACRSIWGDECDQALAGGANLILKPQATIGFSKGGYLSPDGQCRSFSADANGYVRGEGVAAILLKRLSAAVEANDRIYAVIYGSRLNQDGHSSTMTVPDLNSQVTLLRQAYADAQIDPAQVRFIEAHGTGTPVGDPIEANAIGRVIGQAHNRTTRCILGSVKTNLGHLESAAGMAGICKLAMSLYRRQIPPNLNFNAPSPEIAFERLGLQVPVDPIELSGKEPIYGGVNSFGFGGANAHLVLGSPPSSEISQPEASDQPCILLWSARSSDSLRHSAAQFAQFITDSPHPVSAIAQSLSQRRASLEHKAAVTAPDRTALVCKLETFASDGEGVKLGRKQDETHSSVAFVYTGQGPQWWGMGRRLMEDNPVFFDAIHQVDAALRDLGFLADQDSGLIEELQRDQASSNIHKTAVAQPAIFAIQYALSHLLDSHGIVPGAVLGHSIGEVAAATHAGCLSVSEGARLVLARSRAQSLADGKGLMVAVGLSHAQAMDLLHSYKSQLEIAAVNGPDACTLAGESHAVHSLCAELASQKIFHQILNVSIPFHCFMMDMVEPAFRHELGEMACRPGSIDFYSSVFPGPASGDELDTNYWYNNIRRPVMFGPAFEQLIENGYRCFVEIGPHPILMRGAVQYLRAQSEKGHYVPTLRRERDDTEQIHDALCALHTAGVNCRPTTYNGRCHVRIPAYPFERHRTWHESEAGRLSRLGQNESRHPHLKTLRRRMTSTQTFDVDLRLCHRCEPYLADHCVQGSIVVPAATQLELVLTAAREIFAEDPAVKTQEIFIEDIEFTRPIVLPNEGDSIYATLEVYSDEGDYKIASRKNLSTPEWMNHSSGRINHSGDHPPNVRGSISHWQTKCPEPGDPHQLYQMADQAGFWIGPALQGIQKLWYGANCHLARIVAPDPSEIALGRYTLHPGLLDAMAQSAILGSLSKQVRHMNHTLFLPQKVRRLWLGNRSSCEKYWCFVQQISKSKKVIQTNVYAMDDDGKPVAAMEGLIARELKIASRQNRTHYAPQWIPKPLAELQSMPRQRHWLVLDNNSQPAQQIVQALTNQNDRMIIVQPADRFETLSDNHFGIRPGNGGDAEQLAMALRCMDPCTDLLDLWSTRNPEDSHELHLHRAAHFGPISIGTLLAKIAGPNGTLTQHLKRFWVVTQSACTITADQRPESSVADALVWGFARTVMSEFSHLKTTLIDLDAAPDHQDILSLLRQITQEADHSEIAIRQSERYTQQLIRIPERDPDAAETIDVVNTPFIVDQTSPGVLSSLNFFRSAHLSIPEGAVEIAVHACGLNFKDVVVALGLLDNEAWRGGMSGAEFGMECSGIVSRIGEGVTTLRVGDPVVGFARHSLGNRALADIRHLALKSPIMSFEEAACVSSVFLTAQIALEHLARLSKGETVLLHAAAGGVGMASIQVAKLLGAKIIATAGSKTKREFLRQQGVEHVFDSRSPAYRDAVMEVTQGGGVDVVLNSLAGRSLTQGIRCLAPFGRFVEIGKTDIYANRQLGLKHFGDNRTFMCLDINRWVAQKRNDTQNRLRRIFEQMQSNVLTPLPFRSFDVTQVREAMTYLAEARHIGKVAVTIPQQGVLSVKPAKRLRFYPGDTFLVTGGCRGFGLALARWLVEHGARKLVLASRSGVASSEQAEVAAMRSKGAEIHIEQCDVSDFQAVDALIRRCIKTQGSLRGIFHAAMRLYDGAIQSLTADHYHQVIDPKARGAWNLHQASKHLDLSYFVMFSSIASIFGTPGQGNYAAANAFLDELANWRHAQGLAGLSVNWGVIDDTGVVARASDELKSKILRQGIHGFQSSIALHSLEHAILDKRSRIVVADIDWSIVAQTTSQSQPHSRIFSDLMTERNQGDVKGTHQLNTRLIQLDPAQRKGALLAALVDFVAEVAGENPQNIDPDTSLTRLGFDSLMATQLLSWIEENLNTSVTMVQLLNGPSIAQLCSQLLNELDIETSNKNKHSWVLPLIQHQRPQARLICFNFMAGDWRTFASWKDLLKPRIELYSIEMPGLSGPAAHLLQSPRLEEELIGALAPLTNFPFAFYGHSMGGWVALETAQELFDRTGSTPRFIALGALPSVETCRDYIPQDIQYPDAISDEHVQFAIKGISDSDQEIPILNDEYKSRIKRDLWLSMQSRFINNQQAAFSVPTPLVGFTGDSDQIAGNTPAVPGTELATHHQIPGNHKFIDQLPSRKILVDHLQRYLLNPHCLTAAEPN